MRNEKVECGSRLCALWRNGIYLNSGELFHCRSESLGFNLCIALKEKKKKEIQHCTSGAGKVCKVTVLFTQSRPVRADGVFTSRSVRFGTCAVLWIRGCELRLTFLRAGHLQICCCKLYQRFPVQCSSLLLAKEYRIRSEPSLTVLWHGKTDIEKIGSRILLFS